MSAGIVIDGKKVSADIRAEIAAEVKALKSRGTEPGLAVILIGENPASVSYVTAKRQACAETGINSFFVKHPADLPEDALLAEIARLNADPAVHGILVQLPLPKHIDEQKVIAAIAAEKDVDGFHPVSLGKLLLGEDTFVPCTPAGIIELIRRACGGASGKHAVVVGRSNIVGKPVANLLLQKAAGCNATVTVCHTGTPDLSVYTRQADILVVAAGRPGTVSADMVKPGAVVIDVGVNRIEDATKKSGFRLVGDVDYEGVAQVASAITPVPGGVGPMTISMLLLNTLKSAKRLS